MKILTPLPTPHQAGMMVTPLRQRGCSLNLAANQGQAQRKAAPAAGEGPALKPAWQFSEAPD